MPCNTMTFLNKLALGTVQFGLDYGINNQNGKPPKERCLEMLSSAYRRGIKIFDTAHTYGSAEEILGEFCKENNFSKKIRIITKVEQNVEGELNKSLKRLKTDSVDGCLLHEPKDIKNKKIVDSLKKIKDSGLSKNIGVSVYEPEDAVFAANSDAFDYIQVPYNIFDQRLRKTKFFELAKKNNKKVFARSAFLQGLLLMNEEKIPAHLKESRPYLAKLDKIIARHGFSKKQAALHFALQNKNIDYLVFGSENKSQLEEVIDIARQEVDLTELIHELIYEFREVPQYIISPNLWT